MKIWDISPPVNSHTAVWPGDVAFSRVGSLNVEKGDSVTLSSINSTLHIGAHADAPSHFAQGGSGIDGVDLEPYWGPCLVWSVAGVLEIMAEHCPKTLPQGVTRVLFQSLSMPAWDRFPEKFSYFHPGAIDALAALGVVLIGIDTPSVDAFAAKDLQVHHAFLKHQIRNLEGLWLPKVKPGIYELCALPLRLTDADASPVRAVLREM